MGDVARERTPWGRWRYGRAVAAMLAIAASGVGAHDMPGEAEALLAVQQKEQRVLSVGYRLAAAGIDLCPDATPQLGLTVHDLDEYALDERSAARAAFGFDGWPVVLAVAPGSPAAEAGIAPGDAIVAIGGVAQRREASAVPGYARTAEMLDRLDEAAATGRPALLIRRAKRERLAVLRATPACRSRFQVREDPGRNAVANGDHVEIDTGLLDHLTSDDELAAILAHEMAHNILHHRRRLDDAGIDPARDRLSARDVRLIRASETEADRLSVHLVDRAGYSTAAIVAYWRRVAQDRGRRRARVRLHLDEDQRIAVIEREIGRMSRPGR